MKFKPAKNNWGTSFKGYVTSNYSELVAIFGKPQYGPNADLDKTTCEWNLEFEDGTVATIYDYKMGRTPFADHSWHIGGYDDVAVDRIMDCVRNYRDPLIKMVQDYNAST